MEINIQKETMKDVFIFVLMLNYWSFWQRWYYIMFSDLSLVKKKRKLVYLILFSFLFDELADLQY